MSAARERLIEAMDGRPHGEAALNAALARPDDLIACLVESGALEDSGTSEQTGNRYLIREGNPDE